MSSYNETVWTDSPESEITAEKLNNQETGIKQAHDGDNIPIFDSYDVVDEDISLDTEWENVQELWSGETMKSILMKISLFFRNVRFLHNFLKPEEIKQAGYDSMADAVVPKIFKVKPSSNISFAHSQAYGFTKVKFNEIMSDTQNHGLVISDDGQIEITEDIQYVRIMFVAAISSSGFYCSILHNNGYVAIPAVGMVANGLGAYIGTYSHLLNVKKGDMLALGIGKASADTTTLNFAYYTVEVIQ